jgi:enoyl-CoA hydratase
MVNAEQALHLGLVNHVIEPEQLIERSKEIAKKLSSLGPLALAGVIKSVNAHFTPGIDGYAFEARTFGALASTSDFEEGTKAFIEKRKPVFQGK